MVIVDTSIWADHFRNRAPAFQALLESRSVLQHPFVTGELLIGNPPDPPTLRAMLESLPALDPIDHGAVLDFAQAHKLGGTGIGYVDVHLLAACDRDRVNLWTRDKRLLAQAERLGLAHIN
jgi:predicted nucleic acid-binding protein